MKIFESKNAEKEIDGNKVLEGITLSIEKGERIGIKGSNGSGKSSLLKLIGGIYEETNGEVTRQKIRVGYVPEHFPENIRFKINDFLRLVGKMNTPNEEEINKMIDYYSNIFAVTEFLNTPLRKCSKGTKQKVGIIQALMNDPELLLMDEPLTGLDDKSQKELLIQLDSLSKEMTIIFTAHEELLVDGLAKRMIMVESGKIVSDSIKMNNEKMRIIKAEYKSKEMMVEIPAISQIFLSEHIVEMTVSATESDKVLAMLLNRGCSILELKEKR